MMAGLPWQTWLLVAFAVVPGLAVAVHFYRVNRD